MPEDREQSRRLRYHAERYLRLNDKLFKRKVLNEIYDGICGNHTRGQLLAGKLIFLLYYVICTSTIINENLSSLEPKLQFSIIYYFVKKKKKVCGVDYKLGV